MPSSFTRVLQKAVEVREEEVKALFWSCAYFFFVLSAYYILRPIRDEMGVAGGVDNLAWLYTGTLAGMLLLHPLFTTAVSKMSRMRFIALTYRFFMSNLLIFFALLWLAPETANIWIGRIFFIWTSVFNLFVVSVFWSFITDIFRTAQGKRLFGFIGVGGTLGGILGSSLTAFLAVPLDPRNLMLVSVIFLEIAVLCVRRLSGLSLGWSASSPTGEGDETYRPSPDRLLPPSGRTVPDLRPEEPIGGGVLDGIAHVLKSPYLLGICGYMFLFTILSTFLYFQQADIVGRFFEDRALRTAVFARIDLAVNILTVLTQLFLTGRILKLLGVGFTLAILPVVSIIGFATLGVWPALAVVIVFQVLRRAGNYAVARPAREVLYTVVPREDRYKAKNFIDTFVYRSGDQVGAWSYTFMGWFGLSLAAIAFVAVPIAGMWMLIALGLGFKQEKLARDAEAAE